MSAAADIDVKSHLAALLERALEQVAPGSGASVALERPKVAEHGDFSCNLALQLAKPLKRNPREMAQALVSALPASPVMERAEIAGAGFINVFLRPDAKRNVVRRVLMQGDAYGRLSVGQGRRVQVEFVSANPTGPLHVGHGRGAA
jgi:arginyl-tRNA synthetase